MDLELFGLTLPIVNSHVGDYDAGDIAFRVLSSTVAATQVSLKAEATFGPARGICKLAFELKFKVDLVGTTLRPATEVQPKPKSFVLQAGAAMPPAQPIAMAVGPLLFYTPNVLTNTLQARRGKLYFHLTAMPRDWFVADGVGLLVNYGMGGVTIDIGRGLFSFEDQFLLCDVGTTLQLKNSAQTRLFLRPHAGVGADWPLTATNRTLALRFTPDATNSNPVVLHAELASAKDESGPANPVIGSVGLSHHALELTFGKDVLKRVRAMPDGAYLNLHTYFLNGPDNACQAWKSSDPLDLHLRPAVFGGAPSSILLAPIAGNGVDIKRAKDEALHGIVDEGQIRFGKTAKLYARSRDAATGPAYLDPAILSRATLPYLDIQGASAVAAAMPGASYLPDGQSQGVTVPYLLEGTGGQLPLEPRHLMRASATDAFLGAVNASWAKHAYIPVTIRHETALRTIPNPPNTAIKLHELFPLHGNPTFRMLTFALDPEPRLILEDHSLILDYGLTKVTTPVPASANPDYVPIRDASCIDALNPTQLHFGRNEFFVSGKPLRAPNPPSGRSRRPLAIVKLGDRYSLEEIFKNNEFDDSIAGQPESIFDLIDPSIKAKGWRGLILFDVTLDYSGFPVLGALTQDPLILNYLAISPRRSNVADANPRDLSIAARLSWRNGDSNMPPGALRGEETQFRLDAIDAAWVDSRVSAFRAEGTLRFPKALGLENKAAQTPDLKIVGNYDLDVFRFSAELSKPLAILDPANGFGPIAQVYIRGAEVVQAPSGATIDLDGDIELRSLSWDEGPWIDADLGRLIRFRKLSLALPPLDISMPKGWRWLRFNYPSLEFDLGKRHYRLFGLDTLELQINSLGISWDNSFDWGSLWLDTGGFKNAEATLLLGLRLSLMKLPSLAAISTDKLTLEMMVGLRPELGRWTSDNFKIGLRTVGFEGLHLELLRFLEINAQKLELARYTASGKTISYIELGDAQIRILGKTLVEHLSARIYTSPDGQRRFIAYIDNVASFGILTIKWVIVGQNVTLPDTLAKQLMAIGIDKQADTTRGDIITASEPEAIILPPAGTHIGEWLFAAAFDVLGGFFEGKFLFQDKNFYGLSIAGTLFEGWFGYKFALSVLYIKRARAEEDSFYIEFTIPAVSIASIRFTGGVVAVEVAMNGGLMLDIGFPWRNGDGSRAWHRTLGAIVTPFQGSGGFYLAKRTAVQGGGTRLRLSAGYALQAGLGATYGGGIFTVWVRAGIFVLLEGEALLEQTTLLGLRISGSIGILVEGGGEISWWIISARIDVFASAEAMTTLLWGIDPATGQNHGQNMTLRLNFNLVARASASACLGSGMFKICKGISVSVSMPFQQTIRLG